MAPASLHAFWRGGRSDLDGTENWRAQLFLRADGAVHVLSVGALPDGRFSGGSGGHVVWQIGVAEAPGPDESAGSILLWGLSPTVQNAKRAAETALFRLLTGHERAALARLLDPPRPEGASDVDG